MPVSDVQRRVVPRGHPLLAVAFALAAPALWIAFVDTTKLHELLVGLAVCLATLLFTSFVARASQTDRRIRFRDAAQVWRIPGEVASDLYVILVVLLKDLLGIEPAKDLFRVCGFDGSSHDPVRKARTVLAVAYTTMTPNTIVVDIDVSQSRMLFHQLDRKPVSKLTRALGAKG
jgi:multisubunit Na+/H+ antiporter MnhE subunit